MIALDNVLQVLLLVLVRECVCPVELTVRYVLRKINVRFVSLIV